MPGFLLQNGLGLGAVFSKSHDPASQEFAGGVTVLQTSTPAEDYNGIALSRWVLPPKLGNVEPGIRFLFSDATTVTRKNTTAGTLTETRDSIDFGTTKDALTVTSVSFIADNVGGAETRDLAQFTMEGTQF